MGRVYRVRFKYRGIDEFLRGVVKSEYQRGVNIGAAVQLKL